MGRALVVLAVAGLGIAVGVFTLDVARDDTSDWFAGGSALDNVALLVPGWALIGTGLAFRARRSDSWFGPLLTAGGFAWFLLEWHTPGIGSAVAFTIGLCLYASCPPLIGHALLIGGRRRRARLVEAASIAASYGAFVGLLGVLPALFFDPERQACSACPRNLVLVADDGGLSDDLRRLGVYAGLAAAVVIALLVCLRLVRGAGAASRVGRPVLAAGIVYLVLVAAHLAASLDRGFLASGTAERRLWLGQAAALVAIAVGVAWSFVRSRRTRSEVARLVVELAQSPPAGGLRDVLAEIVRDPELVLGYPVGDDGRLVDAAGRPVEIPPHAVRTSLVREDRPVAVLGHAPGRLDDAQLVEEVTTAARLALENERLQAEVRARLRELRASRARIVEAGDVERKRLERDLHDGAQQRLVGLSLSLRLSRSQLSPETDPTVAARLDEAETELHTAIAELRELAHGIFPAVLADEGVAAAIEALAEDARVAIRLGELPEERFSPAVETAAYTVVAEIAKTADDPLTVHAEHTGGVLLVEVEMQDGNGRDLVELEDRVGAVEGRLVVVPGANGRTTIRAELPCGS